VKEARSRDWMQEAGARSQDSGSASDTSWSNGAYEAKWYKDSREEVEFVM